MRYIDDLTGTAMFAGIERHEIVELLGCVRARVVRYKAGGLIVEDGQRVVDFGVILSGQGRAYKLDPAGRAITIALLKKGSETGVLLAASTGHVSPVSVQADTDLSVIMIPFAGLTALCAKNCPRHVSLLQNYIGIVAGKGLMLHERTDCLLKPTVRGKIIAYLSRVSREQGGGTFMVPFDRCTMAEYLNVERSALSRELSRMRRDSIIDFHKSSFKLL